MLVPNDSVISYLIEEIAVHVLILWIRQTISDGHSFQIDLHFHLRILILNMNLVGDRRNVFACVTFTGDKEWIRSVVRVDLEELRQRRVEVTSDIILRSSIALIAGGETVTGTDWIIDED